MEFIFDLSQKILIISLALSLGALVIGSAISYFVSVKITKPIQKLVAFTEVVAEGDLTKVINVTSQDEIGHLAFSFQNMQQELKNTFEYVNSATDNVITSSEDLTYKCGANDRSSQSYDGYDAGSIFDKWKVSKQCVTKLSST